MKTKLLKKVRREYSIHYYPHHSEHRYKVSPDIDYLMLILDNEQREWFSTKQAAKDEILRRVKSKYRKKSRAYKLSQVSQKVWHI